MSDTIPRPPGCVCTYEQGDSDCPVHVLCAYCGMDLAEQAVVKDRVRLRAEVERVTADYHAERRLSLERLAERDTSRDHVAKQRTANRNAWAAQHRSHDLLEAMTIERDAARAEVARLNRKIKERLKAPHPMQPAVCPVCEWSNSEMLNYSLVPNGEGRWMCHGCAARAIDDGGDHMRRALTASEEQARDALVEVERQRQAVRDAWAAQHRTRDLLEAMTLDRDRMEALHHEWEREAARLRRDLASARNSLKASDEALAESASEIASTSRVMSNRLLLAEAERERLRVALERIIEDELPGERSYVIAHETLGRELP